MKETEPSPAMIRDWRMQLGLQRDLNEHLHRHGADHPAIRYTTEDGQHSIEMGMKEASLLVAKGLKARWEDLEAMGDGVAAEAILFSAPIVVEPRVIEGEDYYSDTKTDSHLQ